MLHRHRFKSPMLTALPRCPSKHKEQGRPAPVADDYIAGHHVNPRMRPRYCSRSPLCPSDLHNISLEPCYLFTKLPYHLTHLSKWLLNVSSLFSGNSSQAKRHWTRCKLIDFKPHVHVMEMIHDADEAILFTARKRTQTILSSPSPSVLLSPRAEREVSRTLRLMALSSSSCSRS